jgi:subtilisin family serine protease
VDEISISRASLIILFLVLSSVMVSAQSEAFNHENKFNKKLDSPRNVLPSSNILEGQYIVSYSNTASPSDSIQTSSLDSSTAQKHEKLKEFLDSNSISSQSSSTPSFEYGYDTIFRGAAIQNISINRLRELKSQDFIENVYPQRKYKISLEDAINISKIKEARNSRVDGEWTGDGVQIAIVDTGVDYTHSDLGDCSESQFLSGECEKVVDGYDFVNDESDPMDNNGHGTHVAGIAAADGDIKGAAPEAEILAYKVLNSGGGGTSDQIIAGIEKAVENNADIISLSLGGRGNPDSPMSQAVDNAVEKGSLAVVAAGNSGDYKTIGTPGTSRKALTVGSTTKSRNLSYFSSRGPVTWEKDILAKPDLTATGSNINSTVPGDDYDSYSGTSMATPLVSGTLALLMEKYPDLGPRSAKSMAMAYTEDFNLGPFKQGSGNLRADKLLSNPKYVLNDTNLNQNLTLNENGSIEFNITNYDERVLEFNLSIEKAKALNSNKNYTGHSISDSEFVLRPDESKNLSIKLNETSKSGIFRSHLKLNLNNTYNSRYPVSYRTLPNSSVEFEARDSERLVIPDGIVLVNESGNVKQAINKLNFLFGDTKSLVKPGNYTGILIDANYNRSDDDFASVTMMKDVNISENEGREVVFDYSEPEKITVDGELTRRDDILFRRFNTLIPLAENFIGGSSIGFRSNYYGNRSLIMTYSQNYRPEVFLEASGVKVKDGYSNEISEDGFMGSRENFLMGWSFNSTPSGVLEFNQSNYRELNVSDRNPVSPAGVEERTVNIQWYANDTGLARGSEISIPYPSETTLNIKQNDAFKFDIDAQKEPYDRFGSIKENVLNQSKRDISFGELPLRLYDFNNTLEGPNNNITLSWSKPVRGQDQNVWIEGIFSDFYLDGGYNNSEVWENYTIETGKEEVDLKIVLNPGYKLYSEIVVDARLTNDKDDANPPKLIESTEITTKHDERFIFNQSISDTSGIETWSAFLKNGSSEWKEVKTGTKPSLYLNQTVNSSQPVSMKFSIEDNSNNEVNYSMYNVSFPESEAMFMESDSGDLKVTSPYGPPVNGRVDLIRNNDVFAHSYTEYWGGFDINRCAETARFPETYYLNPTFTTPDIDIADVDPVNSIYSELGLRVDPGCKFDQVQIETNESGSYKNYTASYRIKSGNLILNHDSNLSIGEKVNYTVWMNFSGEWFEIGDGDYPEANMETASKVEFGKYVLDSNEENLNVSYRVSDWDGLERVSLILEDTNGQDKRNFTRDVTGRLSDSQFSFSKSEVPEGAVSISFLSEDKTGEILGKQGKPIINYELNIEDSKNNRKTNITSYEPYGVRIRRSDQFSYLSMMKNNFSRGPLRYEDDLSGSNISQLKGDWKINENTWYYDEESSALRPRKNSTEVNISTLEFKPLKEPYQKAIVAFNYSQNSSRFKINSGVETIITDSSGIDYIDVDGSETVKFSHNSGGSEFKLNGVEVYNVSGTYKLSFEPERVDQYNLSVGPLLYPRYVIDRNFSTEPSAPEIREIDGLNQFNSSNQSLKIKFDAPYLNKTATNFSLFNNSSKIVNNFKYNVKSNLVNQITGETIPAGGCNKENCSNVENNSIQADVGTYSIDYRILNTYGKELESSRNLTVFERYQYQPDVKSGQNIYLHITPENASELNQSGYLTENITLIPPENNHTYAGEFAATEGNNHDIPRSYIAGRYEGLNLNNSNSLNLRVSSARKEIDGINFEFRGYTDRYLAGSKAQSFEIKYENYSSESLYGCKNLKDTGCQSWELIDKNPSEYEDLQTNYRAVGYGTEIQDDDGGGGGGGGASGGFGSISSADSIEVEDTESGNGVVVKNIDKESSVDLEDYFKNLETIEIKNVDGEDNISIDKIETSAEGYIFKQVFKIETGLEADFILNYSITDQWLSSEDLSYKDVGFYRKDEGWESLETDIEKKNNSYIYSVKLNDFSKIAVGAENCQPIDQDAIVNGQCISYSSSCNLPDEAEKVKSCSIWTEKQNLRENITEIKDDLTGKELERLEKASEAINNSNLDKARDIITDLKSNNTGLLSIIGSGSATFFYIISGFTIFLVAISAVGFTFIEIKDRKKRKELAEQISELVNILAKLEGSKNQKDRAARKLKEANQAVLNGNYDKAVKNTEQVKWIIKEIQGKA